MRGLTATEHALLMEVCAVDDARVATAPMSNEEWKTHDELAEQGRIGALYNHRLTGVDAWRRPITPQGRLALRLWPLVKQHFEAKP